MGQFLSRQNGKSKFEYKFEYTTISSKTYLTTVKDALDNVLETHEYNSNGKAITSEKHGGVEKYTFNYVDSGSTIVTDALDNTTTYYFTRKFGTNLITQTDGACSCGGGGSEVTQYFYDISSSWLNLYKKVDALGRQTLYKYDGDRNLVSIEDATGTQTFTYNSYGEVLTRQDQMNNVTTNTYSSAGNLLTTVENKSTTPPMVATEITWTNKVNVAESPAGTITRNAGTNAWDGGASSVEYISGNGSLRYTVGQTDKDRIIGLGYVDSDQNWNDMDFAIEIQPDGNLYMFRNWQYIGNGGTYTAGNVLEIERVGTEVNFKNNSVTLLTVGNVSAGNLYVDTSIKTDGGSLAGIELIAPGSIPSDNTTTFTYNSRGQVATVNDPRNNTTTFTYDTSGRLTQVTDANSKSTTFGYNARARVTSVTNALSQTTSYHYDLNDRLDKITHPDTNYIEGEYDLAGRLTTVTDENGHETTYAYDNAYRVTGITDALNHTTTFGYDLMSNLTSQTDALSNVTNFEYDEFGRLKKVKYPIPATGVTRLEENYAYNKLGQVSSYTNTAGKVTGYTYDTANRLTKITDALSKETQFTYNALSQMTKVKDALNQEYAFTYDPVGRVLSQKRNNQTMSFTYDAAGNRATRKDYNGHITSYTYDVLNRLTAIAYTGASSENVSYTYDDLSRLLTATNAAGTVTLAYNNRGRLASEEDVFGHDLEYTYDAAGNRTGLELDNVTHTTYAYDNANRLMTLTDEASNDFTFNYDNANKLTSRVAPNGVTSSYEYDGMSRLKRLKHYTSGSTLYDDQFTYNTANQISQIAGLSQTRNFTYDDINRLTAVTVGSSTVESYAYDAVGNRTASHLSASYTTGSFNRLTATSSASYSYNNNGSMTGKTVGSTNWTYGWNRENRMISASDGTSSVSYQYDALGRRTKRTQGSDVQKYTNDGEDVVLDDINSTITKYQNSLGIDDKLKQVSGGTSKYFLGDHLGSTAVLANSSGASVDSNTYDSFGNPSNTSFTSRYQFTGREFDSLTGQQFSRARWYDPSIGRFILEDPIGLSGGINTYAYVSNNSVNGTDPSGLYETDVHYYLTYYLAMKTGCFSSSQAAEIANGNQGTDEDPETSPGANRAYANSHYHALSPNAYRGDLGPEFPNAVRSRSLKKLGQSLHYFQDSFSHEGYDDVNFGHGPVGHLPDKTHRDLMKAAEMAGGTFGVLNAFGAQMGCKCSGEITPDMAQDIYNFSKLPSTPDPWIPSSDALTTIDSWPSYLNGKRKSLDVPWR